MCPPCRSQKFVARMYWGFLSSVGSAHAEVMVDEYGRPEPPHEEWRGRDAAWVLDYQRATLERKCRGLSDEQLRVALRPSPMTLGGLLKHLACCRGLLVH